MSLFFHAKNSGVPIFSSNDDKQIIISPAALELGGILMLPRKEDFDKITKKEVAEIYDELDISNKRFEKLKQV